MNDSVSTISPAWPTRWPKDSFAGIWAWLFAAFVAFLFVATFVAGISKQPPRTISPGLLEAAFAVQFVLEGALVVCILAALPRLSKFGLRELGFEAPSASTVALAVAGAVAMAVVANGGASLIENLAHVRHEQATVAILKSLHDRTAIVSFVAFAVLFAPIAEETIFRVFFFNFGLRYGGFWGGAILSGVLFGVAHGDLYEGLPLALGGVVLCYVYYRSRNAFASMISHALFNTFSIVALLALPNVT
ncbi:MAG TPA: CPBP family intramembrane glutamic endopeptidase [Candidatus Tumulicola sp.]